MEIEVTVAEALAIGVRRLRMAGVAQPGLDARLLLAHALSTSQTGLILQNDETVDPGPAQVFEELICRRVAREPVSRILGTREFFGRSFQLNPAVLDPRPDTETLVETVLALAADRPAGQSGKWPRQVLDLGTGSGAIVVTLLAEWPQATGLGVDVSAMALKVAAGNARLLGVSQRVEWLCSDWDASLNGCFDLIVSNPPYIATPDLARLEPEVAGFDPGLALDGGPDGLDGYRAVAGLAARQLGDDGWLVVEIGCDQAEGVNRIFAADGLDCQVPCADLAGRDRVIIARRL